MKSKLPSLFVGFLFGVMAASGVLVGNAYGSWQPHMDRALESLHIARHQLEVAAHDKGGHREAALSAVDQAIEQTKLGIAAGN